MHLDLPPDQQQMGNSNPEPIANNCGAGLDLLPLNVPRSTSVPPTSRRRRGNGIYNVMPLQRISAIATDKKSDCLGERGSPYYYLYD